MHVSMWVRVYLTTAVEGVRCGGGGGSGVRKECRDGETE